MKLVVAVAGVVFILFLVASVVVQTDALSQVAAPQTATTLYDSGDPTPEEQLVLEYINRARADPWAEGVRLRNDANYLWRNLPNASGPSAVGVRPPLAMNKALLLSARFHNDDMYNNSFRGHQDTYYGTIPKRLLAFGYRPWTWGENIAWWGSLTTAEDMLMMDGDCLSGSACGHRINLFDPSFEEVGIGWLATSRYLTQDFGLRYPTSGYSGPFLVGVVYDDMNGNNFYDIGEGISGVTITPSTGTYYAVSSRSGGYAVPIETSGTISVTASGSALGTISKTVTLTGANIKLDFTLQNYSTSTSTTSTSETQTSATTSQTQTSSATTASNTQTTTSSSQIQTSTTVSQTQTTATTSETQTSTSQTQTASETASSTSQTQTQTTTSASETETTTSTIQTQTTTEAATSTSEAQTSTSTSQTETTASSTGEAQTTTDGTFTTSPTTAAVTTMDATTNVASLLPMSRPPCVIATATFGSALAPEVVYMRYVRDELIGSTPPGRTLVEAFNTFYYSWSPRVAEAIAGNGLLRAVFRIMLLPLIGIVHVTAVMFRGVALATGQTDWASVFAFIGAAVMTVSVYVALPMAAVAKSRHAIGRLLARSRS